MPGTGDHTDADAGTAAWHRRLHHTPHDQLDEDTAQTKGMRRYEAISGKRNGSRKIWMGKDHAAPGMISGDHHHGEAETGIYVVSGDPVFVFPEDGLRLLVTPGTRSCAGTATSSAAAGPTGLSGAGPAGQPPAGTQSPACTAMTVGFAEPPSPTA
jgi:hypothetical protein